MNADFSNPEVLSAEFERSEIDELNDLIRGMLELAEATGRVSGTQFAIDTLNEMKAKGVTVNKYSMSIVFKYAFGGPEELLSRMQGKSTEELDEMLPGEIGDFAADYLAPVLGKSSKA